MKRVLSIILLSVLMPLAPSVALAAELPASLKAQISATLTGTSAALTNVSLQLTADAQTKLMLANQLGAIAVQLRALAASLPQVDTDAERLAVSTTLSGVSAQVALAANTMTQMQNRQIQQASVIGQLVAKFQALIQLVIQHKALP